MSTPTAIADLPLDTASGVPTDSATGAVVTDILPHQTVDAVSGADAIREAVTAKSRDVGGVVSWLDSFQVQIGHTSISLWDVSVVAMVIGLVITIAWFGSKLGHKLLARFTRFDPAQELLAEKIVSMVIWAIAIAFGIDVLGIDLTAFAFFSGAFGLAIGFGLQKTFGNLIAGIILLLDKSIKPGDVIAITDQAGNSTFGQIRRIGVRAVSLTTRDHKEYLIPNENLMTTQVENWSYSSKNVRMQVPVGISYNADIVEAEKLMLEAAKSVDRVLPAPPPTVWLDGYGDNSVNFVIHCWINDPEEGLGNVRSNVLKKLWALFKENGIEIPFPQRDFHLRDSEELRALIEQLLAAKGTVKAAQDDDQSES